MRSSRTEPRRGSRVRLAVVLLVVGLAAAGPAVDRTGAVLTDTTTVTVTVSVAPSPPPGGGTTGGTGGTTGGTDGTTGGTTGTTGGTTGAEVAGTAG